MLTRNCRVTQIAAKVTIAYLALMRLGERDRRTIKTLAEAHFGPSCVVRLFGSRTHDSRRGGDIDLHLEVARDATFEQELTFQTALKEALGDQRVDVVVKPQGRAPRPIDTIAIAQGIRL